MSRSYRVQIEIKPVANTKGAMKQTRKAIQANCDVNIEGELHLDDYASFWGDIILGAGTGAVEVHDELVHAFPKQQVNTRWLCWDAHPWDEEYEGKKY
jgi:hypothetical protein